MTESYLVDERRKIVSRRKLSGYETRSEESGGREDSGEEKDPERDGASARHFASHRGRPESRQLDS